MADINEIKDAVLGTLGTVADKTISMAGKAKDKAKDVARIAKLNMELNNEKTAIEKAYAEVGKLYYETRKDNPDGFFVQLCDDITLAKENVEKLSREIDNLKASISKGSGEEVEVEFTEVSDEEFEKPAEEAKEDCCCGCEEKKAEE